MKKYFLMTNYGETCGDFFEVKEDENVKEKAVDEYYKWINNPKFFDRSQEIPRESLYKMFEDDSEEDEGGISINIIEVVNESFYESEERKKINMNQIHETDNNQILDNYIQENIDLQNQLKDLQVKNLELRNQVENNKKELIKNDLAHILGEQIHEILDDSIDDIVNYILEREK